MDDSKVFMFPDSKGNSIDPALIITILLMYSILFF